MSPPNFPFDSRSYGGLSSEQINFLEPYVKKARGLILDPMAGQAHYLSQLACKGKQVYLGDLNPGPLLLASLRDPQFICSARKLKRLLLAVLDSPRSPIRESKPSYCGDWISESSRLQLLEYVSALGLSRLGNPMSTSFWTAPIKDRFAMAIPVLAARSISCYTASDNLTWLKKGGLQTKYDIYPILVCALQRWYEYAQELSHSNFDPSGELHVEYMNPVIGHFGACPKPNLIITSPPYANRLDYTRLWAPELEVLATMLGFDSTVIKTHQIGSTVVHGRKPSDVAVAELPSIIQKVLAQIRSDNLYASESYYYPFFTNYALAMLRTFTALGRKLARGGHIVVFVRDTSRKDVLFPAGVLVETVLRNVGVKTLVEKREVFVRNHVGLRRRNAQVGSHGLAQREWWIVMRKA
jgi:hypothetical protein